jgi:hypothetical protein
MKHATAASLSQLKDLIADLRKLPGVTERRPGIFYARGRALLHFHEDSTGLFADIKGTDDWKRVAVNTEAERAAMLKLAAKTLHGRG